ncbi:MAG: hypothetical protein JWL95_20, partial [Gemmatimonadetes bacterium]|nr:hypothetical protein [Gemmatimonadota bacterium]
MTIAILRLWIVGLLVAWVSLVAGCETRSEEPANASPVSAMGDTRLRFEAGVWHRAAEGYEARAVGRALDFAPRASLRGPPVGTFHIDLLSVTVGSERLDSDAPRMSVDGTALAADFGRTRQSMDFLDEGVELSWSFDRPVTGGDVIVQLGIAGEVLRATTGSGRAGELHYVDASSRVGVKISKATWIDAHGHAFKVDMRAQDGTVALRVPASVLAQTTFPAILDPTISAELDVDLPAITGQRGGKDTPSIACGLTTCLVAWTTNGRTSGQKDVFATRVALDGTLLDPVAIALANVDGSQLDPLVTTNGTDFLVVWRDATLNALYGTRVRGSDGARLDGPSTSGGIKVVQDVSTFTVASNGSDFLIVWATIAGIAAARMSAQTGVLLDDPNQGAAITVSSGAAMYSSMGPSATYDGTNYAVSWSDKHPPAYGGQVHLARLRPDGSLVDGPPSSGGVVVADVDASTSIAFDGAQYLVCWLTANTTTTTVWRIEGARIRGSDMTVLDAPPILLAQSTDGFSLPSLAFDGINFFATYGVSTGAAAGSVQARRVRPSDGVMLDGTPTTDGIVVAAASAYQPSVAAGGTADFLVWSDTRAGVSQVYGGRVRISDSALLDNTGLLLSKTAAEETSPVVASNGQDFFVVWSDLTTSSIRAARLGGDSGAMMDPMGIPIVTGTNYAAPSTPDVASGGSNYLVGWANPTGQSQAIFAARVRASDGVLLDTAGIPIPLPSSSGYTSGPALACDLDRCLLVYDQSSTLYAVRLRATDGVVLDSVPIRVRGILGSGNGFDVAS